MAFTPLNLDGRKAAQRMLDWDTFPAHQCLRAVHQAFPFEKSDRPGAYTSARVQWERTPSSRRHPGDRNVPAGAVVLFSLDVNDTVDPHPGHICLSLGGEKLVSTDWRSRGKVGEGTISALERKWTSNNVVYLGWTDVVGGHNVIVGPVPGDGQIAGTHPKSLAREQLVIAEAGLHLRAAADVDARSLGVIPRDTIINTGRASGAWEEAQWGSQRGWVHTDWVIWCARTVNASRGLNVRESPSVRGELIDVLPHGTKVRIIGYQPSWRLVTAGRTRGWVHAEFLA